MNLAIYSYNEITKIEINFTNLYLQLNKAIKTSRLIINFPYLL